MMLTFQFIPASNHSNCEAQEISQPLGNLHLGNLTQASKVFTKLLEITDAAET